MVCATNTNIGKTHTSILLIKSLLEDGYKVGVFKPIETGVDNIPLDASILKNSSGFDATLNDISPYNFKLSAAPIVAKGDLSIDFEFLKSNAKSLQESCDVLIIESVGGLMTPIENQFFVKDFAKLFDAHVLLIGGGYLGSISDIESARYILEREQISYDYVINIKTQSQMFEFEKITNGYFKETLILPNDLVLLKEKLLKSLV